jgi:DNA-binding NarL/FixJ family response regulator
MRSYSLRLCVKIYSTFDKGDQALHEYQKSSKTELPVLSSREKEIMGLIAEGYTNP